jgi:hypothetical protein
VIGPDCPASTPFSTPGLSRFAGIERSFNRLPGSDFTFTALPSIRAFLAA